MTVELRSLLGRALGVIEIGYPGTGTMAVDTRKMGTWRSDSQLHLTTRADRAEIARISLPNLWIQRLFRLVGEV